jgi:predicted kinase
MTHTSKFIMLIGTQLSGKTTFYKKYLTEYSLLSHDFFIETKAKKMGLTYNETCSYLKDELSGYVKKEYEYLTNKQKSFVLDSMNLTKEIRKPYINFLPNNYKKIAYFFYPLPYEVLVERSKKRLEIYVSEYEISESLALLEIPTINEGFDEIITIKGNENE